MTQPERGLILVVDDESHLRHSITLVLASAGYSVCEAGSVGEALALWRARRDEIQLVMSDLAMPAGSGEKLAALLRAEDPAVKILFTSGYDENFLGYNPADKGPFLAKPWTVDQLLETVSKAIDSAPFQRKG